METDIKKELLFPVPLYSKTFPLFMEKQQAAIIAIKKLQQETEGVKRSNTGGWHSHDDLHHSDDPDIAWIMQRVQQVGQACIQDHMGANAKGKIQILNAWANINEKGDWNMPHNHLPCQWSGCFYIKTNNATNDKKEQQRNNGNIIFMDPAPFGAKLRNETNAVVYPEAGMMLIFPAYLMHMVEPQQAEEERVSIAFNMQWLETT